MSAMPQHDWVAPYVAQLLAESVGEIAESIEGLIEPAHTDVLRRFFARNPAFQALCTARATSYWNEYHRARYPDRRTYPSLAILGGL